MLEVVGDVAEGGEVEFSWVGFGGEEGDVGCLEAFGLEVREEFEVEVAVVAGDVDAWWWCHCGVAKGWVGDCLLFTSEIEECVEMSVVV